jgi:Flp pilus assembly protein TadD
VEIDTVDVGALGNLAAALMQCGEIDEAQAVIDRALEIEPEDRINQNIKNVLLSKKTKQ